jgi:hypothetical protein
VVVFGERRKECDGDEGQAEMFRYVACHVCLVDEHGVEVGAADGVGAVAEDHARGVLHALDGEAEGCEAVEFAETLIQLLQGAKRVVFLADEAEFDAGGFDAGFGVRDAEDDYFVATLFQAPR